MSTPGEGEGMEAATLARAMVEFADTLTGDYDVYEFLQRLCERCVEVLDVSSAGVSLASADQELTFAAASDDSIEVIERLEVDEHEGPCHEAYHGGVQVIEENLRGNGLLRWPRFARKALAAGGPAAVFAFPLRLGDRRIGAMNLFRNRPGPFTGEQAMAAQALADIATIGILHARRLEDATTLTAQLQYALDSRVLVEQAKGVIAEREGISTPEAFQRLRGYARRNHLPLRKVTEDVISARLSIADET